MHKLRVALCDDVELVRRSLLSFLAQDPTIEVAGSFASGPELIRGWDATRADLLLLDVRMPGMDGPHVAGWLRSLPKPPRIVYLTSYPDEVPIGDALGGLVTGALSKDLPPDDLIRALHLAAGGTTLLAPRVVQRQGAALSAPPRRDSFAADDRERDVLSLLCRGYTNEHIAHELNRSVSSVKQILAAMSKRAGVSSRTELVLFLLDARYPASEDV